jgi:PAS domain S-box-containing protein
MKNKTKNIALTDLIDIAFLNQMFEEFYRISKVTMALIEPDGNILVAIGWQRACTDYHRKGKISCKNCIESDSQIALRLHENPPISYKCKNGLNDVAMPIIIEGNHVANLFFGQFFYNTDERDLKKFEKQAKTNNFNVDDYLKAIEKIPVYTKKEVNDILSFFMSLLKIITDLGHKNLLLGNKKEDLEILVNNKTSALEERVKELNCLYKISDYSFEEKTIESFLKKVIEIIPTSFQYPEYCSAKITLHAREYSSQSYKKTNWELKRDIKIDNQKVGEIVVNYLKQLPSHDQGPFLKEELHLIDGIAKLLSQTVDYKFKEIELKEKNEEYLSINEELNEKNEEFLSLNKELKERNEEYGALNEEYLSQNEELKEHNEKFQVINEELEEEMEKRAEAQKKIQLQHESFLAIFNNHPDIMYVVDPESYEVLFVNENFKKILGNDPLGQKCFKSFQGFDEPCSFCTNDVLNKNPEEPYVWEYHNPLLKKDFLITDQLIDWPDGRKVRFELAIDITERKKAETALKEKNDAYQALTEEYQAQNEELKEHNEEFQAINEELEEEMAQRRHVQEELQKSHEQQLALLDGIDDVVYVADPDTFELLHFNKPARDIWGQDAIGKKCYKVLQNRDEPCPFCSNDKIFGKNTGKAYVWEFQNEVDKHWYRCADKAIKWNNGKMVRFELASDISELKNTQEALKVSEERYSLAMEGTRDGLWDWNLITNKVYFSKPWKKIIGYKNQELENSFETWESLVHPDDIGHAKKAIDDYLIGKTQNFESEFRMKHKKGHWVNILSRGKAEVNEKGEKTRFAGTHLDVTELRKVEKELQNEKDLIERYFSLVEALIVILDKDGKIVKVNRKACEILGYNEKELIGKDWFKTCIPEYSGKDETYKVFQRLVSGKLENASYFENKIISKQNEEYDIAWHNNYMRDEKGNITSVISAGEDITELKANRIALEESLKKLQVSNRDLEQFAYVASHDLQEPLRKIKNFTQLFAQKYSSHIDEKAETYINYITNGASRMQNLIMDLLSYSRVTSRAKPFEEVNLHKVIEEVKDNIQLLIEDKQAQITSSDLPIITADPTQIKILFQNLFENAIKFQTEKKPIIKVSVIDKNTYWKFSVKDNGIGMEMEEAKHIFEIFKRLHTQAEYPGTGIGLANCKKIAERHGGEIWAISEPNKGTTINFTILKNLQNEK